MDTFQPASDINSLGMFLRRITTSVHALRGLSLLQILGSLGVEQEELLIRLAIAVVVLL